MRSNEKPTTFNAKTSALRRKTERVRSASTRIWQNTKCIRTRNAFEREFSSIPTIAYTRLNNNLRAFQRGPTRGRTRTFMRLNEDLHAFNRQLNAFISHVERVCVILCVWWVLYKEMKSDPHHHWTGRWIRSYSLLANKGQFQMNSTHAYEALLGRHRYCVTQDSQGWCSTTTHSLFCTFSDVRAVQVPLKATVTTSGKVNLISKEFEEICGID